MGVLYVGLAVRLILGAILVSASVTKFAHPATFQRNIQDYNLLPTGLERRLHLSALFAWGIPVAEALAGAGLIIGVWLVPAIAANLLLLFIFTGAVMVNLLRGRRDLSCHCGGVLGSHLISWWLVARNAALMGILLLLLATADAQIEFEPSHFPSALTGVLWANVTLPALILVGLALAAILLWNAARVLRRL